MTTYNKTFPYNPQRRKKQRYALIERVIDFSKVPNSGETRSKWRVGDILQAIWIRGGQTVLGVEFELMQRSDVLDSSIDIGIGDYPDLWGRYMLAGKTNIKDVTLQRADDSSTIIGSPVEDQRAFGIPVYFSTGDTIDVKVNDIITSGKIRLIVHILEDDK